MADEYLHRHIDPGLKGGFTAICDGVVTDCFMMDKYRILETLRQLKDWDTPMKVCLEKVHAMPRQGTVSMFTFGEGYGWLKGVLDTLSIPYQEVSPVKWKKEFELNSDKTTSIEVCQQLFPGINLVPDGCKKPSDGMAESCLLAEFARRHM